jgi:hypothetical protein
MYNSKSGKYGNHRKYYDYRHQAIRINDPPTRHTRVSDHEPNQSTISKGLAAKIHELANSMLFSERDAKVVATCCPQLAQQLDSTVQIEAHT